jgi:hypothetical protein
LAKKNFCFTFFFFFLGHFREDFFFLGNNLFGPPLPKTHPPFVSVGVEVVSSSQRGAAKSKRLFVSPKSPESGHFGWEMADFPAASLVLTPPARGALCEEGGHF